MLVGEQHADLRNWTPDMIDEADLRGVLAQRLDHLFRTVHPPDRGPYTLREAAQAINETMGSKVISAAYLAQLRNGQRTEPSHSRLAAIARFFGVDVRYFSDDETAERTDEQLALLAELRDSKVRGIALRTVGLSDASLDAIRALIDNARRLEGLPEDSPLE
jgi:transcriptional regulator with XRE-family HTH domain